MQSQSELRQTITSTIIDAIKNGGLPPWRKPWSDDPNAPGLHTSMSTGFPYRGINQLLLQIAAIRHGFKSKWWGTFNQVAFNQASVKQGQKATKVVLWKPIERKRANENGEEIEDKFLVMREFCVFNAEQTTGLEKFQVGFAKPRIDTGERYEKAERAIEAIGADIRYGGNKAFYSLAGDFIQLPFRHQFDSPQDFIETTAHELCHWCEKRIGFDRSQAENSYAFGELVAEIGCCLMMGELGLPTTSNLENHVAYLKNWLKGMADDSRYIFRAASLASKAVDFLLTFSRSTDAAPEQVREPLIVV
jgi:antirestriction protein ArdC